MLRASLLLAFVLVGSSGCYASVGPTLGYDLSTERATIGVEGSSAMFTAVHEWALGNSSAAPRPVGSANVAAAPGPSPFRGRPTMRLLWAPPTRPPPGSALPAPEDPHGLWQQRTYLLWEPGATLPTEDFFRTKAFSWPAMGGSLGARIDYDAAGEANTTFVGGAWFGAGSALISNDTGCHGKPDTRPYVALVLGFRGAAEVYLSTKLGVLSIPDLCQPAN